MKLRATLCWLLVSLGPSLNRAGADEQALDVLFYRQEHKRHATKERILELIEIAITRDGNVYKWIHEYPLGGRELVRDDGSAYSPIIWCNEPVLRFMSAYRFRRDVAGPPLLTLKEVEVSALVDNAESLSWQYEEPVYIRNHGGSLCEYVQTDEPVDGLFEYQLRNTSGGLWLYHSPSPESNYIFREVTKIYEKLPASSLTDAK